ncbi:hypothetical protein IAQ00_19965 [Pantoea ananatis]|uniref:hypothetical protein n=1 Tax=Pantoea ananas TaxID=553 RepID=UPI00207AEB97|nr:hypothetical protein [Pantoea ananatis]USL57880.1 hypothetical protein IAQ00_19965 [Pantoea ananatis]
MAKGAKLRTNLPAKPLPKSPKVRLENLLCDLNLGTSEIVDYKVVHEPGRTTLTAKTTDGQNVRVSRYDGNNGLREASMSVFQPDSIAERRIEARRLKDKGHTQMEIAEILGVSQKTISNDLSK